MKTLAVLTVCLPLYIYAQTDHSAKEIPPPSNPQAQAQAPEPNPTKPDMPDTTLVGTKKQQKDAKKKADKEMKKKEKEVKQEQSY